jgi:hypothetical protein
MAKLNFYINRAGENLSSKDKSRLEHAKGLLKKLYGKNESIEYRISRLLKEDENEEGGEVTDKDIEDLDASVEDEMPKSTTVILQGENIVAMLKFLKENGVEGMQIKIGGDEEEDHQVFTLDENDLISSIEISDSEEAEKAGEESHEEHESGETPEEEAKEHENG